MFEVPNVTIASKCCLEDPEWKPPFEAGIVITNFAFNGDESTPHLHMIFVPYSDNCSRGQKTQNALAQTFTRMGYKTIMEQAQGELSRVTEELDEATRKKNRNGFIPCHINGRNMLDVFRERIGEVKEWVHRKVAGMGR